MPTPITQAQAITKGLEKRIDELDKQSKLIVAALKASTPSIANINTAAENALKTIPPCAKDVSEAKTIQVKVDTITEAKTCAADLKSATTDLEKKMTALKGEAEMAQKIADKSEAEDKVIGTKLSSLTTHAEKSLESMQSFVLGGSGLDVLEKQLSDLVTGKMPHAATVFTTLKVVQGDLKDAGADITTAESVSKNIPPLVKEGEGTYIPSVRKQAEELDNIHTKLDSQIAKARQQLNKELKAVNVVQEKLKSFK